MPYLDYKILVILCLSIFLHKRLNAQIDTSLSTKYYERGVERADIYEDYEGALKYLDSSIYYNPSNWKPYLSIGIIEFYYENYERSLAYFDKGLLIDSDIGVLYFWRGRSRMMLLDYEGALEDFTKAYTYPSSDNKEYNLYALGHCNYKLKKYKEAIPYYTEFIEINPSLRAIFYERGICYRTIEDYEKALNDFKQCINLSDSANVDPSEYYFERGRTFFDMGNYKEAKADMDNYLLKYQPSSAQLDIYAQLQWEIGDTAKARQKFKESLEMDSTNTATYYQWGYRELFKNGDIEQGIRLVNRYIIEAKKKNHVVTKYTYFDLGNKEYQAGHYDQARVHVSNAIELDSNFVDAIKVRLNIHFDAGGYLDLAIADASKIIELEKDMMELVKAYVNRAYFYYEKEDMVRFGKDMEMAISMLFISGNNSQALRLFYAYLIYVHTNEIWISNEKYNGTRIFEYDVIRELDKIIEIDPTYWRAYTFKAYAYYYAGESEQACFNLQKAIEFGFQPEKNVKKIICKGKKAKDITAINFDFAIHPVYLKYAPLLPEAKH